ncbi:MAG: hypothetical protein GF364_15075 [Candidatus Lokiarchaeota archaeon]|nr:hypothetical protein [Candidatus Lokiarchaeota archaeon]
MQKILDEYFEEILDNTFDILINVCKMIFDPASSHFFFLFLSLGIILYVKYRAKNVFVLCLYIGAVVPLAYELKKIVLKNTEENFVLIFNFFSKWNKCVLYSTVLLSSTLLLVKLRKQALKAVIFGLIIFGLIIFGYRCESFLLEILSKYLYVNCLEIETFLLTFIIVAKINTRAVNKDSDKRRKDEIFYTKHNNINAVLIIISLALHIVSSVVFSYFIDDPFYVESAILSFFVFLNLKYLIDPVFQYTLNNFLKTLRLILLSPFFYLNILAFWRAEVQITTKPAKYNKEKSYYSDKPGWMSEDFKSFLIQSPQNSQYLDVFLKQGIALKFSTHARKQTQTTAFAEATLQNLKSEFTDIDGKITSRQCSLKEFFGNTTYLKVIQLPKAPFPNILPIFKNICQITSEISSTLRFFIVFQAIDKNFIRIIKKRLRSYRSELSEEKRKQLFQMWEAQPLFKIKMYIGYSSRHLDPKIFAIERKLTDNLLNIKQEKASIKKVGVFSKLCIYTGHIPNGCIVTPKCLDFDLRNQNLLIKSAIKPEDEIFSTPLSFTKQENKRLIEIGHKIQSSSISTIPVLFNIDDMIKGTVAFGKTRTGKTNLASHILYQIHQTYPDISQIIFCTKDNKEALNFYSDQVTGLHDSNFRIPYLCLTKDGTLGNSQTIMEIAETITSGLGLLDNAVRYIQNYLIERMETWKGIPRRLEDLLTGMLKYLDQHKYGQSHQDIYTAIEQRVQMIISNTQFCDIMELGIGLPDLIHKFLHGNTKIIVNLLGFNKVEQRLLVMSFLNILEAFAPVLKGDKLKHIIFIDEAHNLFQPKLNADSLNSDNIAKELLEQKILTIINQFANRAVGLFISEQNPLGIFEKIRQQMSNFFFFRISEESSEKFSKDENFKKLVSSLPDYNCYVKLTDGSKFLMRSVKNRYKPTRQKIKHVNEIARNQRLNNTSLMPKPVKNNTGTDIFLYLCKSKKYREAYTYLHNKLIFNIQRIAGNQLELSADLTLLELLDVLKKHLSKNYDENASELISAIVSIQRNHRPDLLIIDISIPLLNKLLEEYAGFCRKLQHFITKNKNEMVI